LIGVEEFDLGTVADDTFKVVLSVASSNRHLIHMVHLTEVSHHRLGTCEQFAHVANETIFPTETRTAHSYLLNSAELLLYTI